MEICDMILIYLRSIPKVWQPLKKVCKGIIAAAATPNFWSNFEKWLWINSTFYGRGRKTTLSILNYSFSFEKKIKSNESIPGCRGQSKKKKHFDLNCKKICWNLLNYPWFNLNQLSLSLKQFIVFIIMYKHKTMQNKW